MRAFYCFLILVSFSFCKGQELYHRILNSDNGLPSNKVHYVYEDSKGYIWFGTENGAARWDSKNFVYYTIKDGLPNNEVLVIYEDSKGRIWFSTFSNELCYLQNDTIFNRKRDKRLEKINIIKGGKLCEHRGEIYYFNYPTDLPQKFDIKTLNNRKTGIKIRSSGSPILFFINDTFTFQSGYELGSIVSRNNVNYNFYNWKISLSNDGRCFKLIDGIFQNYYLIQNRCLTSFLETHCRKPISCSDKIIDSVMMYGSAIQSHNFQRFHYTAFPIMENHQYDIKLSGGFKGNPSNFHLFKNEILFDYEEIFRTDKSRSIKLDYKLNYSKILGDKLTIITENNTLFLTDLNIQNFNLGKFQQSSISKLFHWENTLNILCQNGVKYNLNTKKISHLNVNTKSYNLDHGELGQLFLTTYRGRGIINVNSAKELTSNFPYNSKLFKGFSYSSKYKLYTINNSSQGLFIQDLQKKATKISDLYAYTSFIDSRDRLWIGTVNKLYVTNTFLPKVVGEKEVKLNKDLDVFCSEIKEDTKGNIFFATNDGVYILDKRDRKYHISDKNYLSSNEIVTLKLDTQKQSFFVATRNGVNQIKYGEKNGRLDFEVVNKFFKEDGLSSNEIRDILIDGDSLWVATAKGLDLINNKRFRPDTLKIPIHVNKVLVNDSAWRLDSFYVLEHYENNIKIDYSAIYYQRRDRLDIRYRLIKDGDTSGGKVDNSVLNLFSLASGDYTLQLCAYDKDYPYVKSGYTTLKFQISPPYYKTWWFYSLIFLGLLAILGSFIWYRVKKREEQLKLIGEVNKYKLQGLQHQMNPHFVFNSMSTIQDLILTEHNVDALDFISDFSHLMRTMLQNSRNELISLKEELNFLKRYIELEHVRHSATFDYEFDIRVPEEELSDIYLPTMMIQPILENAIKHGVSNLKERKGMVVIRFSLNEESSYLITEVIDNGVGKSSTTKSKSHTSTAINVIRERLLIYEKNGNKGDYTSTYSENGAIVVLKLPI